MDEIVGKPGIGGIKMTDFEIGSNKEIIGVSGNKLLADITDRSIEIKPQDNESLYFRARVDDDEMTVSVKTKNNEGKKHPDMYARELTVKAYHHFINHGALINRIRTRFLEDSDNFRQFYQAFNDLSKDNLPIKEQERRAVNQTWSGQLYKGLGFSKVVHVGRGTREKGAPEEIWVIFER